MRFNKHLRLEGQHAFLSPSQNSWVNYSPDRLVDRWTTSRAAMSGTAQHEYACQEILARRISEHMGTLGKFINDSIEAQMVPEQLLYYSENCFGTADAIGFRYRKLRIYDLKTGVSKVTVRQLEIYAALFCLEYEYDPEDIKMEFRIYQNNECTIYDGDPVAVRYIMDKIVSSDSIIDSLRMEERT